MSGSTNAASTVRLPAWAWPLLLGLAAFTLLLFVGSKPELLGMNSDGVVYLLRADVMRGHSATTAAFKDQLWNAYSFPPLFPLLLALVGGGSTSPRIDYLFGAFLLAVSVGMAWCWTIRSGGSRAAALASALPLWLSPIALITAMGIFSEPLYLVLTLGAFALIAQRQRRAQDWYIAAALLGLAAITRTVGIFAVLGLLLSVLIQRPPVARWKILLLSLLPSLIWNGVKHAMGWHSSYAMSLYAGDLLSSASSVLQQVPINLQGLAYHSVRAFDWLRAPYSQISLSLLGLLSLLQLLRRLRGAEADAFYVAAYLTVLAAWPYPNDMGRLVLVVLPLLTAYAVKEIGLQAAQLGLLTLPKALEATAVTVLALVMLPSALSWLGQIAHARTAEEKVWVRIPQWFDYGSWEVSKANIGFGVRISNEIRELRNLLPEDACVSSMMPESLMLNTGRLGKGLPAPEAPLSRLRSSLAACPYVVMIRGRIWPNIHFPEYYPATRLPDALRSLKVVRMEPLNAESPPLLVLARYEPAASPSSP